MSPRTTAIGAVVLAGVALAAGFGLGRLGPPETNATPPASQDTRKVLYWYDPMVPAQHFDKPGKSPFMDMQLIPKYAGEAASPQAGLQIDPAKVQNLGLRVVTAERGSLASAVTVTAAVDFNERDVAVVQAKSAGFVQKTYGRAPGDIVPAGAALADLLVPEWAGAQTEYLAVRRTGDPALARAARQRLTLLGMPAALVDQVERTGQVRNVVTVATPSGGVIKTLAVRPGMSLSAGQTMAEVNGLSRVWLNAAVPETLAGQVRVGQPATATFAAFAGETFPGRVTAILPQAEAQTRTLTARIEMANPRGRLRPGMFATVELAGPVQPALLVPSEAVIRTGKRTLVMLAQPGGRFTPAEIQIGRQVGGRTEVLAGIAEGEKVVASGQFLLDSEASLSGLQARPVNIRPPATSAPSAPLYESRGRVEQITPTSVTLSHEPVPAIGWPAMTMQFRLADPGLAKGVKTGDRVAFAFDQPAAGPTVRRMSPAQ